MMSGETQHAAVLERNASGDSIAPSAALPGDRFKLLATNKSSTLQTELSALAARGYRVLFASAVWCRQDDACVRRVGDSPRAAAGALIDAGASAINLPSRWEANKRPMVLDIRAATNS